MKKKLIKSVLGSLAARSNEALLSLSNQELRARWNFRWDESGSIEWNIYSFINIMDRYKTQCRRWEEHHNGGCCVVERVRDQYVLPRIRDFLVALKAHQK